MFWCCCFHETKAKKQGNKEQQKNKECHKKNKQQGKKQETRKRERERETKGEVNEAKEKERETQRNELLTPKNEGFRANCPKTHVQGCVDPKPKKKTKKRANTKRGGGEFQEIPFQIRENGVKRRALKNSEKPSWQQPQGYSRQRARLEPKTRKTRAPKISQIGPRPGTMWKRHFQNDLSSAAPSRFLPSKSNQKFEHPKKICETRKNYSQKNCAESRRCKASKASRRGTKTQNCSETPCFEAFRVLLPLGVRRQDPRRQRREENENFAEPKKNAQNDLQNGISENKQKKKPKMSWE